MAKIGVLFVCMGNLCRSPTAQAVFTHYVAAAKLNPWLVAESAGTHVGLAGDPPDERAKRAAAKRGYDLSRHRTRVVRRADFERFDYVLAADENNLASLLRLCPQEYAARLKLLMAFGTPGAALSIPDPYFGNLQGFERVLDMVEDAAQGLLRHIRQAHGL